MSFLSYCIWTSRCNRWRVEESWWSQPITRDYFKVAGSSWLALLYLDRIDGTWHLERIYD